MKPGIIGVVFLLAMPISLAQEIISYNISVKLEENSAREEISVLLLNQHYYPLKTFSYSLRADAVDVEVLDDKGSLVFNVSGDRGSTILSKFRVPLQPNASTTVTIKFKVPKAVSKAGSEYIFSPVFSLPAGTEEFRLRIRLPEGMGLPRPIQSGYGYTDVVPLPDRVHSDGKAIILEWTRFNEGGDFAVYIRYARPPGQNKNLYIATFFAVLILMAVYLRRSRQRAIAEQLGRDEIRVLDLIKEKQGIAQRDIVENTGFSKAKVSSIISDLEDKGIIRKKKSGLINRLFLTDKYRKL